MCYLFIAPFKSVSRVPTNTRAIYSMPYYMHMLSFYTVILHGIWLIFMPCKCFTPRLQIYATKSSNLKLFLQNLRKLLEINWTSRRLTCTHYNVFSQEMQMWQWKNEFWIFMKKKKKERKMRGKMDLVVCNRHWLGEGNLLTLILIYHFLVTNTLNTLSLTTYKLWVKTGHPKIHCNELAWF